MSDDELTDAAKAEIAEAVRIVREDKFLSALDRRLSGQTSDTPPPGDGTPPAGGAADGSDGTPAPPPAKPEPATPPKKKGVWWGDRIEDDAPSGSTAGDKADAK